MVLKIETNLASHFLRFQKLEALRFFEDLPVAERLELIESLPTREAIDIFQSANPDSLIEIVSQMSQDRFFTEVDVSALAQIVNRLAKTAKQDLLAKLPEALAKELMAILSYPPGSAGSLMETRFHLFHPQDKVNTVIKRLRGSKSKNINSIFVVDVEGQLLGRVSLQDLVITGEHTLLKDLLKPTPSVNEVAPKDEIVEIVENSKIPSIPVVNSSLKVLGIIRHETLVTIAHQDALDDIQKMVGVSSDEKALSPARFSIKKRLPWLTINLLTTFVAAFVVGLFEDTIAKITALAVLLPVVAGQSGNTGAQAQAVTMRGLALREIRLRHKWRVLAKEGSVGFVNGLAIGLMCSVSVYFWSGSLPLAMVIGVAMIFAMVAASLSGAAIPMLLSAVGQDPATSSSIILTTITDIVGFLSFLGLATVFGNYIA